MPSSAAHRHLHPFPTRRSSDLLVEHGIGVDTGGVEHPPHLGGVLELEAFVVAQREQGSVRRQELVRELVPHHHARLQRQQPRVRRSEEHTSELQSLRHLVCRLLPPTAISTRSLHAALPIFSSNTASASTPAASSTRRTSAGSLSWRPSSWRSANRARCVARNLSGNLSRTTTPACSASNPVSEDRKSTRLNSSHLGISYAVFCRPPPSPPVPYTPLFRSSRRTRHRRRHRRRRAPAAPRRGP